MKWIKSYRVFESLKDELNIEEVDDRLIDFKHLGFSVEIGVSSSIILDFDKKRLERSQTQNVIDLVNKYHIKSSEIDHYNSGISKSSLTIGLKSTEYINLSINDLTSVYDDFCYYLEQAWGLKPNYIHILRLNLKTNTGGGYVGQFLYFKDFESIREFLQVKNSTDCDNIEVSGFHLGFYK